MCLLAVSMSSLEKSLVRSLNWYWVVWAVCIFWKSTLVSYMACKCLLPFWGYLFVLSMASSAVQKLWGLIKQYILLLARVPGSPVLSLQPRGLINTWRLKEPRLWDPAPWGILTSLEQVLALITAFQYSIFDTHSIWLWNCLAPRVPEAVWSSGSKPLWRYWPRWDSLVQKVPTDKGCDKSPACILQLRLCSCQKHIIFPKGNSSDHVVCRPASPQALTTANCEPMPSCSSSETLSVWQLCRMLTSLT